MEKIKSVLAAFFGLGLGLLVVLGCVRLYTPSLPAHEEQLFGLGTATVQPYQMTTDGSGTGAATTTNFIGSIVPLVDAQYDVGTSTKRWRNGYFSGTLTVANCSGCSSGSDSPWLTSGTTVRLTTTTNNVAVGGTTASQKLEVQGTVSSTAYVVNGNITPVSNNSSNLGAFGSAFANLYVSTTAYMATAVLPTGSSSASAGLQLGAPNNGIYSTAAGNVGITAGGTAITWDGTRLAPGSNNSRDIGNFGTAFRSIYSSTTFFGTNITLDKTVIAAGTTGAQTINKSAGCVNFAASASSLVVTDSLVTASSVVLPSIQTHDASFVGVQAVPTSGSFTLYSNTPATAETRVCFLVIN